MRWLLVPLNTEGEIGLFHDGKDVLLEKSKRELAEVQLLYQNSENPHVKINFLFA